MKPRSRPRDALNSTLAMSLLLVVSSAGAQSSAGLEPFEVNPSRPTYTNSPGLGPRGGFEINIGFASNMNELFIPVQLKYAVSRDWEMRLGYNVVEAAYADRGESSGFGDTQWTIQWCPSSLQWPLYWALWVLFTTPTGSSLRAGEPEFGVQLGLALAIEWGRWTFESNIFADRSIVLSDKSTTALNSAFMLSFSVNDAWTLFLEDYDHYAPADLGLETRLLGGVAWGLSERVVLDVALDGPVRTKPRIDEIILHGGVSFILPVMERRTHTATRFTAHALR